MSLFRSVTLTRMLAQLAREYRCTFSMGGEPEAPIVLMSAQAFLPVIALHADVKCRELLKRPLHGIEFRNDPAALLGVYAAVEPLTGDEESVIRAGFFTHAALTIFGIGNDMVVECMPVYEAYRSGLATHLQNGGSPSWPMARVSPR